jgi:hypothetical protein
LERWGFVFSGLRKEGASTMIPLPYGGKNAQFDEQDLISYISKSGRGYIIQGQQKCTLSKHTKPNSLDYWLRVNYAANPNTKQAVNEVMEQLVRTGLFEEKDNLICPDSGYLCKGLGLKSMKGT